MDRSEEAFGKWAETHGKKYSTEEERAKRYKIWLDNLSYIEEQNAKQSSYQVVKKLKFIGHEAKAIVRDVYTQQMHNIYMYGNWLEYSLKIYLGKKKEGGRLLAFADRKLNFGELFMGRQTYNLTVMPGVDSALCVLLCIAFDEFWNENN